MLMYLEENRKSKQLGSCEAHRGLGTVVDGKLEMSLQCDTTAIKG